MCCVSGVTSSILGTSDGVLHLAGCSLGNAVGLQLGITQNRAQSLLYRTFELVADSLEAILVHGNIPSRPHAVVQLIDIVNKWNEASLGIYACF
jgi:hypothetical protein